MNDDTIEFDDSAFKTLIQLMTEKVDAHIKVGIMGSKSDRPDEDKTDNAYIGLIHEYGTEDMPERSFLRMPLSTFLGPMMDEAGVYDHDNLNSMLDSGTIIPTLEKIAVLAESIVIEAFDTGGFGAWPPSNMDKKKNQQTLVETQQLRNSITAIVEVK